MAPAATPFPSPTATWHDNTYASISPRRPELSAKGKNVLITGGGSGIGAETARSFATAGAARIALLGRREQPLLETKASIARLNPAVEVFTASTDVTDKQSVDAAFEAFLGPASSSGGGGAKLDIVVSNAGMTGPMDPVRSVDPTAFIDSISANLRMALTVAQAFVRHASAHAVAIETNSSAAHVNFGAGFAAYNVAKLAVFRLWDSVGFSHPGLRVYHVQPGVVDTDMNKAAGGVAAVGVEDHVSLPADFYVWLASNEAGFLKGKYLWANWDVDELKARERELAAGTQLSIGLVGWPFGGDEYEFKPAESAGAGSAFLHT